LHEVSKYKLGSIRYVDRKQRKKIRFPELLKATYHVDRGTHGDIRRDNWTVGGLIGTTRGPNSLAVLVMMKYFRYIRVQGSKYNLKICHRVPIYLTL
jgi:hypothetical protein